mmetsp:Transcript_9899/g.27921  ORF Transcript_9899/g.27921 Transcript_9899/m.27921 type:complete len:751 (+) Transcript_9899:47-2299(+)
METTLVKDGEDEPDPVKVAAIWVEKAQAGSVQWTSSCTESQIQAHRLRRQLKPLTASVKYALLALAVFEVPSYCMLDASRCPAGRPDMHSTKMPVLPFVVTNSASTVLYAYLAWYKWLRSRSLGPACTWDGWQQAGAILVAVALVDCVVSFFNTTGVLMFTECRLSRLLRPLVFLCYTRSLRQEAGRVARSIPKYVDVFASLAICIMFFTWVGLILFTDSKEGTSYFGTWSNGITSLYILFTTANCPDVFLDAYEKNRAYFLFFFSFIIITLYLLSNVLLASVYDAYKDELKSMVKKHFSHQSQAMGSAFALLANERGVIAPDCWSRFFSYLCDPTLSGGELEYSDDVVYNKRRANQVFQVLDKDHNQGVDIDEFKLVLDVVHNSEVYIPRKPPPDVTKSTLTVFLKDLFTNGVSLGGKRRIPWEEFMDCVILMDVSIVFFQTLFFVNGGHFHITVLDTRHAWYWSLFAFSSFYVLTVSLKMGVLGMERFWHTNPIQHRFDFFNVYGCFAAEVACLYKDMLSTGAPNDLLKIVLLLHVTRILRIIHYLHPLKQIANFVVRLAPTYYRMGMLLVLVYYIYVQMGQQFFGGLIYDTNPALAGTGFAESKYWPMNFNDFNSGMVTLFVLMVVNNWFVITGAYIQATGTRWAAAFFVSFFFLVNLIVLNILLALILDCSGAVKEELAQQEALQGDDVTKLPSASHAYDYEAVLRRVLLEDQDREDAERPFSSPAPDYGSTGPAPRDKAARRTIA